MQQSQQRANVLVCEDDPNMPMLVERLLLGLGHRVTPIHTIRDLFEVARSNVPDLIIMDVVLGGANGFDVVQELQRDPVLSRVPIIFMTALSSKADVARGLTMGAVDYVVKPFENREFTARIQAALRVKFQIDELQRANEELSELALLDPLTGMYNRRFVLARLAQGVSQARRYVEPLACLMLDMDRFKRVNDQFGHLQGDLVLQDLARLLIKQVRSSDTAGKYGGEEFIIVSPQTSGEQAVVLAERIRVDVANHPFPGPDDTPLHLTVSIGVASLDPERDVSGEALLSRADQAMYRAKQAGGNAVRMD